MKEASNINDFLDTVARILIRCFILGILIGLFGAGFLVLAGDFVYDIHSKFIPISKLQFNCIHYGLFSMLKTGILYLFLIPYIAIKLVLQKILK